jgi:hypothetical protein
MHCGKICSPLPSQMTKHSSTVCTGCDDFFSTQSPPPTLQLSVGCEGELVSSTVRGGLAWW